MMSYNFSKEYLKNLEPYAMVYSYQGHIDHRKTTEILTASKVLFPANPVVAKKVYIVANELLENTVFHRETPHEIVEFFVLDKNDSVRIIAINASLLADYEQLLNKSEELNSLNQEEVKETYHKKLLENTINKKGTIGVGLNLIRLRTNNKIIISVEEIQEKYVVIVDVKVNK